MGGGAVVGAGVGLGADTTPSVVLRTIVLGGGCCCRRLSRDAWASAEPRNSRPVSMIEPTAQFRQPINRTLDLANLVQHTLHIPRTSFVVAGRLWLCLGSRMLNILAAGPRPSVSIQSICQKLASLFALAQTPEAKTVPKNPNPGRGMQAYG